MALPANTIPLTPVDFCGKQVMSFKEAFWVKTFENPALSELLTIIPGVKAKQQVVILGLLNLVGRKMQTENCAPDASDQTIPSVQKFYEPGYVEDRFVECWKNLLEKFYVWGLKNGINKPDLTGTDFADFLEDRVIDGLIQSVYRIVWFSDTDAAHFSDGGIITNSIDVDYINVIDGLWKQFFAIAGANPTQFSSISNNSGGLATPDLPTLETAASGGSLAAATYYVKVAAVNASGVSIASAEASQVTTGSTSTVTVTYAPVTGASGYRVYIGTTSGAQTVYFADTASPLVVTTLSGALTGSPQTVNTATTYAGQRFTAQDVTDQKITKILQDMVNNADERLAADELTFYVTRSVAQQYQAERRAFLNIDEAYRRTETGWDYLEIDGIKIMVLKFEDRFIKQFHDSGVGYYLPHRIYLTTKDNLHMATEEEGSMTDVEAFYDQKSKEYYIDMLYTVDVLVIEDYKVQVAY